MMEKIKDIFRSKEQSWIESRISFYLTRIENKKINGKFGGDIVTDNIVRRIEETTKRLHKKEIELGKNHSPKTLFTCATDSALRESGHKFKKKDIANWTGVHKKTYRDFLEWADKTLKKEKIPKAGD